MKQYRIELADGSILTSGAAEECAIREVRITYCVNPDTELNPGGVCAGVVEVTVLDPTGKASVAAGDTLRLYAEDGTPMGAFIAQKPERTGTGQYRISASDEVSRLDVEVGQWLRELPGWPYRLEDLAKTVCAYCGLELGGAPMVNGDYLVEKFTLSQVTARQILQWICQLGGCFCRANPMGGLELAWYRQTEICIKPTGEHFYYRDGLSGGEYETAPIEKVRLRRSDEDVGAIYPDDTQKSNTMCLTGNPLLGSDAAAMEEAARQLYLHMNTICYTPCTLRTSGQCGILPGDIFQVEDSFGRRFTAYAMNWRENEGVLTVECTGSQRRDSSAAVNTARYESANGRMLCLQADVEGLKIQCSDDRENLAALTLDVEGLRSQVSRVDAESANARSLCTKLEQDAQSLSLQVQTLTQEGVEKVTTATGYTFDETGLRISKAGQEMENLLDNTGMYVRRSGQVILQANAQGVEATDVTVRNYLIIGDHCRLEDYSDGTDSRRTACFFLN